MADFLAGFNAKATIDTVPYAFATYRVRAVGNEHNVSNTEGFLGNNTISVPALGGVGGSIANSAVFESRLPGLIHLEATVRQATFDLDNNPFATPIDLGVNFYYAIDILTITAGPAWSAESFLINDIGMEGDVNALQPVDFSGKSDGGFFLPVT